MLILLALPFVFYMANSKEPRNHNFVDRLVVYVSTPVQWLVVSTLDGVSNTWRRYIGLVGVEHENEQLRVEIARLRHEVALREELLHENERLRLLVGLQEKEPLVEMIFARVVATSPTPLFRSIRVNRGRAQKVALGAPVVSHDGVVGRVAALNDHYADIMLAADSNSSIDVLVQRTRARARVRGQGGDDSLGVQVQYLSRIADVQPGDILITSGIGQTFPKGLKVGTIIGVKTRAFGLYQDVVVEPSVNFGRLETVMILPEGVTNTTNFEIPRGVVAPLLADDERPAPAAEPLSGVPTYPENP